MNRWWIRNVRLVFPGARVAPGSLLVAEGTIQAIDPVDPPQDCQEVDGGGKRLTPGLIDVHAHGIHTFFYEAGAEAMQAAARILPRYGTTTVVPTVCPQQGPDMLDRLHAAAQALSGVTGLHLPGLHVEGPFIAIAGAACATLPGDLKLLDDIFAACGGHMAIMSLSPEQPGIIPVIERLREHGVVVFMTHTRATPEQTQRAIDAGASHATHFYDVFPVPEATDPGVRPTGAVETVLANRRVSVDFIADGVHVHPMAIRAGVMAKGWQGVVAITDANIGAGLPAGEYDTPWGFRVRVSPENAARHSVNNSLAGSALTMNAALRNLMTWLDLPREQVWAMGTCNPARVLGLAKTGVLTPGADADLVLWNDDLTPDKTWCRGALVFDQDGPAS
jgi:N-acetylglucosamine-6-phosphate deacetylase